MASQGCLCYVKLVEGLTSIRFSFPPQVPEKYLRRMEGILQRHRDWGLWRGLIWAGELQTLKRLLQWLELEHLNALKRKGLMVFVPPHSRFRKL